MTRADDGTSTPGMSHGIPSDWSEVLAAALQPVVTAAGRVMGHEALLRQRSGSGFHGPAVAFAAAKREGWVHELDIHAAALGLEAAAAFGHPSEQVFVNCGPMPVARLVDWLAQLTTRARTLDFPLSRVVVELNEEQPVVDAREFRELLDRHRADGLSFALDDVVGDPRCFGLMETLRPEVVKLDGLLVREPSSRQHSELLDRLVDRARVLGATVVAEQVENDREAVLLAQHGVTHYQGWLCGRPVVGSRPSTDGWSLVIGEAPAPAVALRRTSAGTNAR